MVTPMSRWPVLTRLSPVGRSAMTRRARECSSAEVCLEARDTVGTDRRRVDRAGGQVEALPFHEAHIEVHVAPLVHEVEGYRAARCDQHFVVAVLVSGIGVTRCV